MKNIELGLKGRADAVVDSSNIASLCDPGLPQVFSTPKLVELIECAGINALKPYYDDDELSVGVTIDLKHMASTYAGEKVYAEVELTEIKGIKFVFSFKAFDEHQQIGQGTHTRAIVKKANFK